MYKMGAKPDGAPAASSSKRLGKNLANVASKVGKDLTPIEAASVVETLVSSVFERGISQDTRKSCFEVLCSICACQEGRLRPTAVRVLGMRQLRKLLDRYKATPYFCKFLDAVLEGI